jgi:hypothetical protein
MIPYTILLTSCMRFDLLQRTLDSLIAQHCGGQRALECIIVEDSPAPMPLWLTEPPYAEELGNIRWVSNGGHQGQVYSADRLWALCTTEYAFWLEDDWLFLGGPFTQKSFDILENHPRALIVMLRGTVLVSDPCFPFPILEPYWGGGWNGFSFNPGLRRKSDYLRIGGSYANCSVSPNFGYELMLSKMYLDMGYVIADLGQPLVQHIGEDRHVG